MAAVQRLCRLCGSPLLPSRTASIAPIPVRHLSTRTRTPALLRRTSRSPAAAWLKSVQPRASTSYRRTLATIVGRPTVDASNDLPPELMGDSPDPFADSSSQTEGIDLSPSADAEGERSVNITEAAANQVRKIQAKEKNPKVVLRLAVESGGCHGYQYKIQLTETVNDDDYTFAAPPSSAFPTSDPSQPLVVIDSTSLSLLSGATVDYATELIGSSFRIPFNPNASGAGCGCGVSFSM